MNKEEWLTRIGEFVGEISSDKDLNDDDYVEVLSELQNLASVSIDAKQAEQDAEQS